MEYDKFNLSCKRVLLTSSELQDVQLTLPSVPAQVLDVKFSDEEYTPSTAIQNGSLQPLCISEVHQAPISQACYLTNGEDVKEIISVNVDVKDFDVQFSPGDAVAVLPCNFDTEVDEFASSLNVKKVLFKKCFMTVLNIKKKQQYLHIPCESSLYHVLKSCVDFRAVPKKVFLRVLSDYTSDTVEKRCLQELCCKEGNSLYRSRILDCAISIKDIFCAFPSCQPPIGRVLELLPRLQPRSYSIASSPLVFPKSVRIVLSVVKEPVKGLCSGWLHDILQPLLKGSEKSIVKQIEDLSLIIEDPCIKVPMYFRKTCNFNLPDDLSVPLILVGPGTGIAPFIGFLQHRAAQKQFLSNVSLGDIWLFYGCRYADRDFLFRSEIEQFLKEGIISHFFVSFSRESDNKGIKYVQDNMKKHAKSFVHQVVDKNSMIYVCGDGKNMAKDVWETIVLVISSEKGISAADANDVLMNMLRKGTYKQEIWM